MITLLLIAGVILCAVLYRSITSLLSQIPDGNRDFNAFLTEGGIDSVASAITSASRHTKHLNQ